MKSLVLALRTAGFPGVPSGTVRTYNERILCFRGVKLHRRSALLFAATIVQVIFTEQDQEI